MATTNTVDNVGVGKPNVNGALYVAPVGTTLPTDAETALDAGFAPLGYVSDDGVTNGVDVDSTDIKAWGGDTVYSGINGKTVTWQTTLIEILNVNVLKTVYGSGNVTGTLSTGIAVQLTNEDPDPVSVVIDMEIRGNLKRVVLPNAKVTDLGDVTYADDSVVGYETTFTCMADTSGVMQYEYMLDDTSA
jgi:hypothetical protein